MTRLAARVPGLLAVLDDREMWEIAEALRSLEPPRTDGGGPIRSVGGRGTIARRMAAYAAGEPEPEPLPPDPAVQGWAAQFAAVTGGGTPG